MSSSFLADVEDVYETKLVRNLRVEHQRSGADRALEIHSGRSAHIARDGPVKRNFERYDRVGFKYGLENALT